jgi:hypothetical protein
MPVAAFLPPRLHFPLGHCRSKPLRTTDPHASSPGPRGTAAHWAGLGKIQDALRDKPGAKTSGTAAPKTKSPLLRMGFRVDRLRCCSAAARTTGFKDDRL